MSTAKPCLGYPSRTEAVLAFRRQGLTTAAIADRIGIKRHIVHSLESSGMRSPRRRNAENCRTVVFPVDLLDALGPHAARRGITPNELARRIVETAIDDKLIDGILDDADAVAGYLKGAA